LSFRFDNSYARDLEGLYERWSPAEVPEPTLVVLNDALAAELDLDAAALRAPDGVAVLAGNATPHGASPIAQAYAGHQFGGYSPRLGDGRALLLGEVIDARGRRRDIHLKGSGRTPFARGGDGKAVLGPMLREYLIGEAMHALGIPTTRGLAVVTTGEQVARDTMEPGAVLTRVASSLLRVGTFQFAAATGDPEILRRLADYAIARHRPEAADADDPYLAFYEWVVDAQAALVAQWMHVGFVHGVMNTDNMAISGETIDYGPCAFIDAFDPAAVYSSIDHGGRYAFGNQPQIAQWNLARLAETLLPLIERDEQAAVAAATDVLGSFAGRFERYWGNGMLAKLGLGDADDADGARAHTVIEELLALLSAQRIDYTSCLRALSAAVRGEPGPVRSLFTEPAAFDDWSARWSALVSARPERPDEIADGMDRVNPVYVPRNHLVEEALAAATAEDTAPFDELLAVLADPYVERTGLERFAQPAPPDFGRYRTFCGT
jgi:uncharacterized protein YdiU (UPF0061 family)